MEFRHHQSFVCSLNAWHLQITRDCNCICNMKHHLWDRTLFVKHITTCTSSSTVQLDPVVPQHMQGKQVVAPIITHKAKVQQVHSRWHRAETRGLDNDTTRGKYTVPRESTTKKVALVLFCINSSYCYSSIAWAASSTTTFSGAERGNPFLCAILLFPWESQEDARQKSIPHSI